MGFRDLFRPKPADAARAGRDAVAPEEPDAIARDQLVIDELRKLVDLGRPRDTRFFLYFASEGEAQQAGDDAEDAGFAVGIERTDGGAQEPWRLVASRDMVVDEAAIADARRVFERIAVTHWGTFAGWEAAASD
jgi:hypothetical protein